MNNPEMYSQPAGPQKSADQERIGRSEQLVSRMVEQIEELINTRQTLRYGRRRSPGEFREPKGMPDPIDLINPTKLTVPSPEEMSGTIYGATNGSEKLLHQVIYAFMVKNGVDEDCIGKAMVALQENGNNGEETPASNFYIAIPDIPVMEDGLSTYVKYSYRTTNSSYAAMNKYYEGSEARKLNKSNDEVESLYREAADNIRTTLIMADPSVLEQSKGTGGSRVF